MVEVILFVIVELMLMCELESCLLYGCDVVEVLICVCKCYEGWGVYIVKVGDVWVLCMVFDFGYLMQKEIVEIWKFSCVVIEILVIIVYYQFVICVEIEEICGVLVSCGIIDQLIEMEWICFGCCKMMLGCLVIFVVI